MGEHEEDVAHLVQLEFLTKNPLGDGKILQYLPEDCPYMQYLPEDCPYRMLDFCSGGPEEAMQYLGERGMEVGFAHYEVHGGQPGPIWRYHLRFEIPGDEFIRRGRPRSIPVMKDVSIVLLR